MALVRTIKDLDSEITLLGKKREALKTLFNERKISRSTFETLEKKLSNIETMIIRLKETIEEEKRFWKSVSVEKTRILESLLVNFRFLNLIDEIDYDKWLNISKTITFGMNILNTKSLAESKKKTYKTDVSKSLMTKRMDPKRRLNKSLSQRKTNRSNRRTNKVSFRTKEATTFSPHCMNPWKPECTRTDIKLSIYYNGRFLPICEECWREISKKNIEWSTQ